MNDLVARNINQSFTLKYFGDRYRVYLTDLRDSLNMKVQEKRVFLSLSPPSIAQFTRNNHKFSASQNYAYQNIY